MRVAVITPYYKETDAKLWRAHESVAAQTYPCTHFMIADGFPNPIVETWPVEHIVLPKAHADNGNTPRCIGALSALNRDFDAIAYLDADNWFDPDHVGSLVDLVQTAKVPLAFSDRWIVGLNGEALGDDLADADRSHVDTSCILHTAEVANLIPLWAMMDKPLSPLCDRVFFYAVLARKLPHAWTGKRTMYFESNYGIHYDLVGLPIPEHPHIVDHDAIAAAYSPQRCRERLGYVIGMGSL